MIGKHLATFNVFREPDGLYVTCADASGVRDELNGSGAPLHLCAMSALRSALQQMDARAASGMEARRAAARPLKAGTPHLHPEDSMHNNSHTETNKESTMAEITIRKIDIDNLGGDGPPTWGRINVVVNGVELQLKLDADRIERLIGFAEPLVMEAVDQIINAPKVVVELKREHIQ